MTLMTFDSVTSANLVYHTLLLLYFSHIHGGVDSGKHVGHGEAKKLLS